MKKTSILIVISVLLLAALASCSLPFGPAPTPVVQGTPNATLTALFDTSHNIPATVTPYVVVVTATPQLPTVDLSTATSTLTPMPTFTQTLVPTATATTVPTAVNTAVPPTAAPAQRPNAQLVAMYLSTPPVQDGTYAEWVDKTNKYTMSYFAWGKANWTGHADLEGVYAVAWDNNYLYIGTKVTDDTYTQNNTGDQMYVGDDIELLIDTNLLGDFYTTTLNSDDYHLGLSAGNPAKGIPASAYLWNPSNVKGTRSQVIMSTQFESSTIYRIEAAIPWSMLGVTPYSGMRLGFAVCVDDNDNVTDYKKVTMMSSANGLAVFNPTTWGELVLMK
jgi:hypothetical protein